MRLSKSKRWSALLRNKVQKLNESLTKMFETNMKWGYPNPKGGQHCCVHINDNELDAAYMESTTINIMQGLRMGPYAIPKNKSRRLHLMLSYWQSL